jgi:hypothetical protein
MVDFGKLLQVVAVVEVDLAVVEVEMMVVVLAETAVVEVVEDLHLFLLVGLVYQQTTQDTDILQ